MKKGNSIILSLIIMFSLVAVALCIFSVVNNKKSESDAIKFRNEYMELNDKINENSG